MKISITSSLRPVGIWLLALAVMVYVMVVLGGLTRLSGSGLSMTEWQPFTLLPPLTEGQWQAAFAKYQASPQYLMINQGMGLSGFKAIYWLEYLHRLWGRLIGLAFLLPLLTFLAQGRLGRADLPRLLGVFALGALQGLIGWLMVKSGLSDRPEVSHYRLALHLTAALAIYGALLWTALGYLGAASGEPRLKAPLLLVLTLVSLTIPAGALVAGLHAGLVYNSFPLMDGGLLPPGALDLHPLWRNAFENLGLVQFDHRLLAVCTWSAVMGGWLWSRRLDLPPPTNRALALLPLVATLQAGLGIMTLLLAVPLPVAAAHQAGAFLLFGVTVWALRA